MSYVALATNQYEQVTKFYGRDLGFRTICSWDRPAARGCTFDLGGLCVEVLDAVRENRVLKLESPADRVHLVVEVDDVEAARAALAIDAPVPEDTSWGARLFRVRDPDGIWVTYVQRIRGDGDDR